MATISRLTDDAGRFARRAAGSWHRRRHTSPPAGDRTGFYAAGDPGAGRRGEVLATESLPPPPGAVAWRVRYRTTDATGRPVAASMSVAAPAGHTEARRPVVVWVHGAVGVAAGCGPSRLGFEAWYGGRLVGEDVVVVAPDLTGLGIEGIAHPYLHGTTAGRSVLDAARAAADLAAAGAGDVVALAGHSAGGHAVLWANELATTDDGADLDVRIAVAMAPISDLPLAMARYATTRGFGPYAVSLAATWSGVEPVLADDALTPAALARVDVLRTKRLDGLQRVFGGNPARWLRPGAFSSPAWVAALERQSAGRRPAAAPVLLVHGDRDDAVPVEWTHRLTGLLRQTGQAEIMRTYPDADHMTIHDAAGDDVVGAILDAVA